MQKSFTQPTTLLSLDPRYVLTRWVSNVVHWVAKRAARAERHAAVKSALLAVASRHPDWTDIGFDEHFLTHRGAPFMAGYYQTGELPDAAALASAWSDQYFWQSTTKAKVQLRFLPITEDFVYNLRTEPRQAKSRFEQ